MSTVFKEACFAVVLKCATVAFCLHACSLVAQDDSDDYGPKPTGAAKAQVQYEAHLKAYTNDASKLVLPGLLADREARTVAVMAESTGLGSEELAEFLLVDQGSSHGYEALLWSYAKPSDVHRALQFIGLKPGTPYNPAALRFWSNGDRVTLSIRDDDSGELVPIERLILDTETGETLPEEGFVFAGSITVPSREKKGETIYVADVYDPRSVASIYNEPAAVLDVPRQVSKGESYGHQVVNPDIVLSGGEMITIVMEPGDPDAESKTRNLTLDIDYNAAMTGVVCRLTEKGVGVVGAPTTFTKTLERVVALNKEGNDVYLELGFRDALPVADAAKGCVLMAMVESMGIVRINPPQAGQLYYRAFVPDKGWREPEGRPTQPWELHLFRRENAIAAEMVLHEEVWSEDRVEPTYNPVEFEINAPDEVPMRLAAHAKQREAAGRSSAPEVLLLFPEAGITYGELTRFISPALKTHGTVYVFTE